jgi:hypothetical protein
VSATSPFDLDGQAREALASAVSNFGVAILSNPQMLGNVFRDLLPDSPREVSLLVAAAEANVPAMLQDRISKHMDPDTAARLTASDLVKLRALDSAACLWATSEFARALGYPISDAAISTPIGTSGDDVSAVRGWPSDPSSSAAAEGPSQHGGTMPPATGVGEQDRTRTQGAGGFASDGPPKADGWDQQVQVPPSGGGRRRVLVSAVVVVVLVAGVAVALLVGHHPGKGGALGHTTTTKPPPRTTIGQSTVTTTPPTTNPPSLTPLDQLVPSDDQDPSTCVTNTASSSDAGVVSSLRCADPDLNGTVFAIQYATFGEYESSLANFNNSESFDAADAASECPASSGDQGIQGYSFQNFPAQDGQVVECLIDNSGLTYLWTLPSENAYMVTTQEDFSTINSWWADDFADPD